MGSIALLEVGLGGLMRLLRCLHLAFLQLNHLLEFLLLLFVGQLELRRIVCIC